MNYAEDKKRNDLKPNDPGAGNLQSGDIKLKEEFNKALLENQVDAVIACDIDLKLVVFNSVARDWLELDASDIDSSEWSRYYNLYDAAGTRLLSTEQMPLLRAFHGERVQNERIAIKSQSQETRYVSCSGSSLTDESGKKIGAVIIMRDISEQLANEKTLRQSEALYRDIFDSNPSPMWVIDVETQQFLAVNDAAINHYGWSREEFSAMTMADIVPAETDSPSIPGLSFLNNGLIFPLDSQHYKKNGKLIDVETTSNPINFNGRRARMILVTDITERRLAEIEIRTVNRLLLMLTNINQTIVRRLPTLEMFKEACTVAVRDGGFRMAWIGLLEPNSRQVKTMASAGDVGNYIDQLIINVGSNVDNGPTKKTLFSGKPVIVHDVASSEYSSEWRELVLKNGYRSMVALQVGVEYAHR